MLKQDGAGESGNSITLHNRSACAAFIGFGKCVSNKQTVIFSKMALLATTSSSMEKKISKQGFLNLKALSYEKASPFRVALSYKLLDSALEFSSLYDAINIPYSFGTFKIPSVVLFDLLRHTIQ